MKTLRIFGSIAIVAILVAALMNHTYGVEAAKNPLYFLLWGAVFAIFFIGACEASIKD